jgi:predicted dehydrogenase
MAKTDVARIAVVGVGSIGEVHLQSLLKTPGCEVVAICDSSEDRLEDIQRRYGIAHAYARSEEMYATQPIDGVVIATNDEEHRGPTEIACSAGVSILLEKPIATTLSDAVAIVEAVREAKVPVVMGFTLRWIPHYAAIQQRVADGEFGQLVNAFARRAFRKMEPRRIQGRCNVNQYLASHDIDYLLSLFGTDLTSVYAVAGNLVLREELGVSDYYYNLLTWRSGARAVVHSSWIEPDGYPNHLEMELILNGSDATAHLLLGGQEMTVANDKASEKPGISYPLAVTIAYPLEALHFVDVVAGRAQPLATVENGLDALLVILAVEESVARAQPVGVDLKKKEVVLG